MKTITVTLDMITLGLCGGANPKEQAEIRSSSVRGQLRWWFRTLGGFKSLGKMNVREQEAMIFGSVGKNNESEEKEKKTESKARAGILQVRTWIIKGGQIEKKFLEELPKPINSDRKYLLYPLSDKLSKEKKAMFLSKLPSFKLHLNWREKECGIEEWRDKIKTWFEKGEDVKDLQALVTVFGCLGALGSRSRRGMGALAFQQNDPPMPLNEALARFANVRNIDIRTLSDTFGRADDALDALGGWLKGWRSHGRTPKLSTGPGFTYAKNDHDIGLGQTGDGVTYRPVIGLPIVQFYSSNETTTSWDYEEKGRFASPVILRPYRLANGKFKALVMFVDVYSWPQDKNVFLSGRNTNREQKVSLELYEKMKTDPKLTPLNAE